MTRKVTDGTGKADGGRKTNFELNLFSALARIRTVIVTLGVWGWIPLGLAELISRIGASDDE